MQYFSIFSYSESRSCCLQRQAASGKLRLDFDLDLNLNLDLDSDLDLDSRVLESLERTL